MEVVSVLRSALETRVGKQRFDLWFGPGTRLELDQQRLVVGSPDRFFQSWLRSSFRGEIESVCNEVLGYCPTIDFRLEVPPPSEVRVERSEPAPRREESAPARGIARRRFADFASFVGGAANRLARAAAETAVERPGELTPLVLYGPTSVGKTHLLEAIWTAVRQTRPALAVLYLTAEQFTASFFQALRGAGMPSFRQKHRGLDVLLLDDLQFFAGKRHTQIELLYTLDALLRDGKQVVLAADRPAGEIADQCPELASRLAGGMICRIEPGDFDLRLGIVAQMARRMDMTVPRDVLKFIAGRLTHHARELSGALCRLQAAASAEQRPIDLGLAEEALGEMIRHASRVVRLPDIERAVCQAFGLESAALHSDRKAKRISQPRMLAMWLARKYTRAALSEIGDFFGRRSHSTVVSAQKRVDDWLSQGESIELAERLWSAEDAVREAERCLLAG